MIIEGRNAVREALTSGVTVEKIMVAKGAEGSVNSLVAQAKQAGVRVVFADKSALDRVRDQLLCMVIVLDYSHFDLYFHA